MHYSGFTQVRNWVLRQGCAYARLQGFKSLNISIDKNTKLTIFKDDVVATDSKNNIFKSEYAEYDKNLKI